MTEDSPAKVSPLVAAIAIPDADDGALIAKVRAPVIWIDITPVSSLPSSRVATALHGALARLLMPERGGNECGSQVVAGGGIEPPTCGL